MTDSATPIQHYSAEDAPRGVRRHVLPIVSYPRDVWRHRWLVANFFRRELLGRFRGSFLGVFWVLVQPIFLFAVYFTVFGVLFGNAKIGTPASFGFALYLFSGIVVFNALVEGTTRACNSVVENGNLVKKVAFPSQLLPVHLALVSQVVFVVGAGVCIVAGVLAGVLHPGPLLLALPLVMVVQTVLTIGLGLLLANLQVFARDTNHLWGILATAWMFLSPVFWYPSLLTNPEKLGEVGETLMALNPAVPLLQAHRLAFGAVDSDVVQFGNFWAHLGLGSLWALVLLLVGFAVFMSRRHKFADLV